MKTGFFSLLAFLMICFAASDANATTLPYPSSLDNNGVPEINEEDGSIFKIRIHYERGRKNEAGICHDRGVCVFDIEFGALVVGTEGLNGEMRKDPSGNILLIIDKLGMTADESIDFTGFPQGPGTFQLSNNSDIPKELKTQLGLASDYQFKAGSYQVTETQATYIVNFRK